MNRVILIGNLGQDAELRHTQAGTPVSNFSIATTERWMNKDGERQELTTWHRIVLWGTVAEALKPYLVKGKQVAVEGKLRANKWTSADGDKRETMEVIAEKVTLLGSREGRGQGRQQSEPMPDLTEDDIPF